MNYTDTQLKQALAKMLPNRAVEWKTFHATWQQRVIALCKVKGIEI